MTVYFIAQVDNPAVVKVGTTEALDIRLQSIASSYGQIELLAVCDGGLDVEAVFHAMFSDSWVEGEWFRRTELMDAVIAKFETGVSGRRIWGRAKVLEDIDVSPLDTDKKLAKDLLKQLMGLLGFGSTGELLNQAFQILVEVNPVWSHRRVRAIWNTEASRIDHFEIRDLNTALATFGKSAA